MDVTLVPGGGGIFDIDIGCFNYETVTGVRGKCANTAAAEFNPKSINDFKIGGCIYGHRYTVSEFN